MPSILLTNYYSEAPLKIVRDLLPAGFDLLALDQPGKSAVLQRVPFADYLLVGGRLRIDHEVLERATRLKMIQRTGVGLDSIDLSAVAERGVPVYVNAGINARSVAEHTILLMLAVLRRLPVVDASVKCGNWLKHELGVQCHDLSGKTVGLIGMGNIGRIVAQMLCGFGVKIIYTDPHRLEPAIEDELALHDVSLPELIERSDIISLHCPLTPETHGIIGSDEFRRMRPGVILINTARGPLIDQSAFIESLRSGKLAGAGLDAFETEPLPTDSPLLTLPNLVLTPHVSSLTRETFQQMIRTAMASIEHYHLGQYAIIESNRLQVFSV